jgi:hypothetical protein
VTGEARTQIIRKAVVSIGVAVVAAAAFRLSFDAQETLAIASGTDPSLGWIYPLTVDAAIAIVTLIALWADSLAPQVRRYLWVALAIWTAASICGNALHIIALPAGRVTVPFPIAVAVNTMPAVTLFLIIHIAMTAVFRPRDRAEKLATLSKPADSRDTSEFVRSGRPEDGLLLELADSGMSYQAIADRTGRSKSWVGERIKRLRQASNDVLDV